MSNIKLFFLRKLIAFGRNRDEVTGDWRRLHNCKLYDLCSSPYINMGAQTKKNEPGGNVARMGEKRSECKFLVGKPGGNRRLGIPRLT